MYLQDKVPTVRKIQLGRGALMRPLTEKRVPKTELVGNRVRGVVFFLARVALACALYTTLGRYICGQS